MIAAARPLLTFYGDDFTGSTDMLESLAVQGLRAALFLAPPDPGAVAARFGPLDVVGVAGVSRTMAPEEMDSALPPVFARLRALGAPICAYKVCSTFDSSPRIGSIGRAIELGRAVYANAWVPLLVGAPILRRYCLFGNLFATAGDETYRLDRHPTMSRHPITPMHEADLRLHLAEQTRLRIGLMDVLALRGGPGEVDRRLRAQLASGAEIVLFDVLDEGHLEAAGRLIWEAGLRAPLFVPGSSGVGYALAAHWRGIGMLPEPPTFASPGPAAPLLVLSGSCAPSTEAQIAWALGNEFVGIRARTSLLIDPAAATGERDALVQAACAALADGTSVIIFTAAGPADPAIGETAARLAALGGNRRRMAPAIGAELGRIARAIVERTGLRRLVVAGGDTSGQVARALGIEALEIVKPLAPGGPLCRAHAAAAPVDGLEIVLKGGQVGVADFFSRVLAGQ